MTKTTNKPKPQLFDPAMAQDLHIVEHTTTTCQHIISFGSEANAEIFMRNALKSDGMYEQPFMVRRMHVVVFGSTYTTYQRESYWRNTEGAGIECLVRSVKVECPLSFRNEVIKDN